eukprot:1785771-Rhodomonas_salina.2
MIRRKRGGFLGALAASLAPMAVKGIGKLFKGRKQGRGRRTTRRKGNVVTFAGGSGVTLSGSKRRGGKFSF